MEQSKIDNLNKEFYNFLRTITKYKKQPQIYSYDQIKKEDRMLTDIY